MTTIDITNLTDQELSASEIEDFVHRVVAELKLKQGLELSLVIADQEKMTELNETYRHKSGSTDVLSFELDSENAGAKAGEIVISWEEAAKLGQAKNYPVSRVLKYLLIHGILHLVGFDHENVSKEKAAQMEEVQNRLTAKFDVEYT